MSQVVKLSASQIADILLSGNFEKLIATVEHESLESKGQVYALKEPLGKIELAKDVSALANSSGGYLLLGVHTAKNPLHRGDEITGISCFKRDLCDLDAYRSLIIERVYPSLAKYLRIEWHPSKKDSSLGIVAISVAPECSTERPYLIGLVQTEGIVTGKLFGFFQRMDDDAEPVRIQELRELLKKGMDSGEVLQKLEDLRQIAFESRLGGQTPSQAISEKELERRFVEARLAAHLDDAPALFLIACPRQPVEFGKIFDSSSSKEAQLLEKPPKFRANGFDLSTYQKAEMVEAKLRRCAAHYRKSLELWKDGVLIFVAQGDSQFLGWGTRENGSSLLINNYAFTEVVTLFLSLCLEIYRLATPIPKELQVHLGLLSSPTKEKRYELSHHKISPPFPPAKGTLAPDADAAFDIRFNLENADVFTEAFRLLSKVYNWFGYPDDQIPYQEQGSNPRRIDRDKFR